MAKKYAHRTDCGTDAVHPAAEYKDAIKLNQSSIEYYPFPNWQFVLPISRREGRKPDIGQRQELGRLPPPDSTSQKANKIAYKPIAHIISRTQDFNIYENGNAICMNYKTIFRCGYKKTAEILLSLQRKRGLLFVLIAFRQEPRMHHQLHRRKEIQFAQRSRM